MPKPTPFKIISDIVSKTTHPWEKDTYLDLAFVIAECESMVDQILKVTGGSTPS